MGLALELVQLLEQLVRGAVERQHIPPERVPTSPVIPEVSPAGPVAPIAQLPLVTQPRPDVWLKTFAHQRAP